MVNILNNKVKTQEKKIVSLEKGNNELMAKVIKHKQYEDYLNKKIEKEKQFQIENSKIVETKEEIEFLNRLLPNKKFKLLYRATKDGDSYNEFHSKVNNKGETITLFKTDKNRKFGGHISKSWNSSSGWQKGDVSYFLFNFNEKKCYKDKNNYLYNNGQFYCDVNTGPYFYGGGGNLCIGKGGSLLGRDIGYEYQRFTQLSNIKRDYEFSGENRFTCVEIEVYQVIS